MIRGENGRQLPTVFWMFYFILRAMSLPAQVQLKLQQLILASQEPRPAK